MSVLTTPTSTSATTTTIATAAAAIDPGVAELMRRGAEIGEKRRARTQEDAPDQPHAHTNLAPTPSEPIDEAGLIGDGNEAMPSVRPHLRTRARYSSAAVHAEPTLTLGQPPAPSPHPGPVRLALTLCPVPPRPPRLNLKLQLQLSINVALCLTLALRP